MSCSKCNKNYPIVNKKYNLCNDCNYLRLNGKSRVEVYAERFKQKPIKIYHIKSKSRPRQQTEKEREIKRELSNVKLKIDLDAIQSNEYYCKGCGISYPGMDRSHILAVGEYKELELDPDNINLLCRSCHHKHESKDVVQMVMLNCFCSDMEYTKLHDYNTFEGFLHDIKLYLQYAECIEIEVVRRMKEIQKYFKNNR